MYSRFGYRQLIQREGGATIEAALKKAGKYFAGEVKYKSG
jgi:hypothetical protein